MNRKWLICVMGLLFESVAVAGNYTLSTEEKLGRLLFNDPNLSLERNQSCSSCHSPGRIRSRADGVVLPARGFVDADNVIHSTPISDGSVDGETGVLNAPSVGYAAFSPFFHWDGNEGLYVGGQFWNGRAETLLEQAKQPFLNSREMAMPSRWAVVSRLKENDRYIRLFKNLYGLDLTEIPSFRGHRKFSPIGVNEVYEKMAQAVAAFEKSRFFNRFSSKFDFYLAGQAQLTAQEAEGLVLFEDKALCSACHVTEPTLAPDGGEFPPLLTDFTYDNIGLPRNVNIPHNPEPDLGLGGRTNVAANDPDGNEIGKHKVMSLRNIELTPPYGHNGVFATLEQIVHFYNTRDTLGRVEDINSEGFGVTGWPEPEVNINVNDEELGDLQLTAEEEAALVAFMKTLTDGYPDWGHDPNVPPGTPSPYADTPFQPFP